MSHVALAAGSFEVIDSAHEDCAESGQYKQGARATEFLGFLDGSLGNNRRRLRTTGVEHRGPDFCNFGTMTEGSRDQ